MATPTQGNVVITETDGFTSVREGGGPISIDRYAVRLAALPTATVYVTVSAARTPQEEADGYQPEPRDGGRLDLALHRWRRGVHGAASRLPPRDLRQRPAALRRQPGRWS